MKKVMRPAEKMQLVRQSLLEKRAEERVPLEKLLEGRDKIHGERPRNESAKRALILRTIFEMAPGKTVEEKRRYYNELYYQNPEQVYEILGVKTGGKVRTIGRGSSKSRRTPRVLAESLAGIRKLDEGMTKELENIKEE
ncbi:MAG: hypothetical protein V1911_01275, partial [Candidatus Micrarchaeota archaeon]